MFVGIRPWERWFGSARGAGSKDDVGGALGFEPCACAFEEFALQDDHVVFNACTAAEGFLHLLREGRKRVG